MIVNAKPSRREALRLKSFRNRSNNILRLAFGLVGFASNLQFRIAQEFSGGLFDSALNLFERAYNAIFVHIRVP